MYYDEYDRRDTYSPVFGLGMLVAGFCLYKMHTAQRDIERNAEKEVKNVGKKYANNIHDEYKVDKNKNGDYMIQNLIQ